MRPDVHPAGSELMGAMPHRLGPQSPVDHDGQPSPARLNSLAAETHRLRAELDQVMAERNQLLETQRRLMELMGTTDPRKIVHDLRNVLNERDLLKTLCDEQDPL